MKAKTLSKPSRLVALIAATALLIFVAVPVLATHREDRGHVT